MVMFSTVFAASNRNLAWIASSCSMSIIVFTASSAAHLSSDLASSNERHSTSSGIRSPRSNGSSVGVGGSCSTVGINTLLSVSVLLSALLLSVSALSVAWSLLGLGGSVLSGWSSVNG